MVNAPAESGEADNLIAVTLPPPTGGWSTKDQMAFTDSNYAIELINLFPERRYLKMRKGYRYHSKSIGSGVVLAMVVLKTGSNNLLLAVSSAQQIYNATASGAATDITTGTPFTGNPIYTQFFNGYVFFASGDSNDRVHRFNNVAPTNVIQAGVSEAYTVGGAAKYGLGPMAVYRSRMYFLELSSPATGTVTTSLWYGAVDAVTGDLTEFPFKPLLRLGGYGLFIATATRAKDFSEDELFVIVSDQGEVLVYQGTYPGDATWSKIGHYVIPRPLGPRAFFYIGPDLCIITRQGVISIRSVMAGEFSGSRYATISDPIDEAIVEAATDSLLGDNYWTGINYPNGNYALINVPVTSGSVSNQYVVNTLSGAWCRFTGQNAFSWILFNDNLYFGGLSGRIFKANNGDFDEDPASEGNAITTPIKFRQAYTGLGKPEYKKQVHFIRPIVEMDDGLNLTMGINTKFEDTVTTNNVTDSSNTSTAVYDPLIKVTGVGKHISVRQDQNLSSVTYKHFATEILFSMGGVR